jgi:hypothetical protein
MRKLIFVFCIGILGWFPVFVYGHGNAPVQGALMQRESQSTTDEVNDDWIASFDGAFLGSVIGNYSACLVKYYNR